MKTPIRYYGGKTAMLPHILPLIPPHTAYIEPFCGGAAVFWAKTPCKCEVLNDTNGNLMNFYRVARDRKMRLHLENLVETSLHSEELWRKTKDIYLNPDKHKKVIRAWALWYQCNFSFGAVVTSSFARSLKENGENLFQIKLDYMKKSFQQTINRLDNCTLLNNDALHTLNGTYNDKQTFAYIDPPYFNADCGHYSGYTEEDFEKLLTLLATKWKGSFLLSNYPSKLTDKYITKYNWNCHDIPQTLRVKGIKNRNKTERLIFNFTPPQSKLF